MDWGFLVQLSVPFVFFVFIAIAHIWIEEHDRG
jgi:hypothetical protein